MEIVDAVTFNTDRPCSRDGIVDLHYDAGDGPRQVELRPGQIAVIQEGEPHVAHPRGVARILVIERHDAGDTVP